MNISKLNVERLEKARWLLLITYSVLFIVVGVDKFFNILVDWQSFISDSVQKLFPYGTSVLIRLFAVIQICAGFSLLYFQSRYALYCILALLIGIFFNVWAISGFSVVIVHDVFMIIHCIVLLWLTDAINSLKI
jgi:hypothetical protein